MTTLILRSAGDPTLLCETKYCPWAKKGLDKYIPTRCIVCPCALLDVMAKVGFKGNCFLVNWKGNLVSEGVNGILGTNKRFPLYGPWEIMHSIIVVCSLVTTYLVLLQCPLLKSMFRNNITGTSGVSFKICGGSPLGHRLLRYSVGIGSSSLLTSSWDLKKFKIRCHLRPKMKFLILHFKLIKLFLRDTMYFSIAWKNIKIWAYKIGDIIGKQ